MTRRRPPIIALAPHPWWNHWLSRQQLLSRLGERGWPVLYSFGPLNLWSRHTPQWRECGWIGHIEQRDHVLVDHPGRLPPLWPKYPAWDRWVTRRHARLLKNTIARHGDADRLIALLFHPLFQPWLELLQPKRVAYHVYDAYHMMENWNEGKAAMERDVIERAALITTSSSGMAANLPEAGRRKARVLNNGADSVRFMKANGAPCPADLAAIPQPRIGYVGSINPKLDLEMLLAVTERHPEWHWVFLGPLYMHGMAEKDRLAAQQWQRLLTRDNLHWLGRKSAEEMPNYLNNLDLHAICYKIARRDRGEAESWVIHGYPTKLHECLATGRPVVAAGQQVIVDQFSHVTRVADTINEWLSAIDEGLNRGGVGTPESRRAVALENTWDKRVDRLEAWLEEMIDDGKG